MSSQDSDGRCWEPPPFLPDEVIVVDDFYRQPERMRDLALRAEYRGYAKAQNFAGKESVKSYWSSAHAERFTSLVGHPVRLDPETAIFGRFRIATGADERRTQVHLDRSAWTGVVYMSLDRDSRGGVGFYRHRATGLERVPVDGALQDLGWVDRADLDERLVCRDTHNLDAWDRIGYVPMAFNRLVLFPGSRLFHAATDLFGADDATARLSQHFFFDVEPDGR